MEITLGRKQAASDVRVAIERHNVRPHVGHQQANVVEVNASVHAIRGPQRFEIAFSRRIDSISRRINIISRSIDREGGALTPAHVYCVPAIDLETEMVAGLFLIGVGS